jgi:flagellar biosynthesis protein FliR
MNAMRDIELFSRYTPAFLFILLRAGIVISFLPFFSSRYIPAKFKIGLIVATSIILTPVVNFNVTKSDIPIVVLREVLFGVVVGLVARFVFFAVEIAGQLMSNAAGISIASFFNPDMGQQSTEIANLYGLITMLIFLITDTHHDLLALFVRSFEWLPVGQIDPRYLFTEMISISERIFIIALKVSAPVVVMMFLTNLLLGFIYRAVPQMNVFFVGYPVYLFVGITVMLLGIPAFVSLVGGSLSTATDEMARVIAIAGR